MRGPALAVHGGAGEVPEKLRPEHERGIRAALEAGRQILSAGGSSLDAVVAAVEVMEDDPAFNAGYGSVLNSEGAVELDAGLMEGRHLEVGAVALVGDVRNPVRLCRAILESPHILFVGESASRFASRAGLTRCDPARLISPRRLKQLEEGQAVPQLDTGVADTVGAVALDRDGNLAAATSTGGIGGKPSGRVGDSPLPGGGFYADNLWGACSTTGWGEALARIVSARRAVEQLERGRTVQQAAAATISFLARRIDGARGGLILLAPDGELAAHHNSPSMTYALWNSSGERIVA